MGQTCDLDEANQTLHFGSAAVTKDRLTELLTPTRSSATRERRTIDRRSFDVNRVSTINNSANHEEAMTYNTDQHSNSATVQ